MGVGEGAVKGHCTVGERCGGQNQGVLRERNKRQIGEQKQRKAVREESIRRRAKY